MAGRAPPGARDHRVVDTAQIGAWYQGALAELYATVSAQGLALSGVAGGVYADGLFADGRGEATVYLPLGGQELGRVGSASCPRSSSRW